MADGLLSTPRSTAARAAATTPHRRSQLELLDQLNSLFDSLESAPSSRPTSPLLADGTFTPNSTSDGTAPRTAPLRLVPTLLDAFERKRGVELLTDEEREQLKGMVEGLPPGMEDQPVGVEDLLRLLVGLGVTGAGSGLEGAAAISTPPRSDEATALAQEFLGPPGKPETTTPSGTPLASTSMTMLRPGSTTYTTRDGSPVSRHRRTGSSSSSSARTSMTASPIPGSAASSSLSRVPVPISRRRTIPKSAVPASITGAPSEQRRMSVGGVKTLKSRGTQEDLTRLAASRSERTYLGVTLDPPTRLEADEQALRLAKQARMVMASKNATRERELLALLTPLQPAQLEALDRAFAVASEDSKQRGKTLREAIAADRAIKGTAELALLGLLRGPLAWDADLVQKALDAPTVNDDLLLELLIGRSPAELALLRAAFAERQTTEPVSSSTRIPSLHSSTSSPAASPAGRGSTRSLDVAVLSAYSSNTRLRKAWEIALKGRWEDVPSLGASLEEEVEAPPQERTPSGDEQARREKLLVEDLDQLKVALRRGGSTEIVAKILLARSPVHLRKLCDEFASSTGGHSTLTRAIKQSVPAGPLQRLFLHAVSSVKHVSDTIDYGVWRDAKTLARLLESEKGPKRDGLVTRLTRYRWDRSRFQQVEAAFAEKYKASLRERVKEALPSNGLADIVQLLLDPAVSSSESATVIPITANDAVEGDAASEFAFGKAVQAQVPAHDPAELEADGEMSDPPSPRSPPLADHPTSGAEDSLLEEEEANASVADLRRSTSSMSSRSDLERPGSALSSHSRASGNGGHRPPSSAGGSADTSRLSSSLRHSRPMAPSRAKRRQSEEAARSQRSASEEPLSPRHELVTSPTFSHGSRDDLSRSTATAASDMSLSASQGPSSGANESAIDTSSFFATPLSPIRDESRPSSMFFPDDHSSTPPPAMMPPFDASSLGTTDLFTHSSATPDSPERFFSSLMRRDPSQTSSAGGSGSRPSSLFGEGMLDSFLGSPQGHAREGSATIRGNEHFQQLLHHAQDLARKLKDNEARFHTNASQYESEVSDLEGQLEEARAELHSKRREEKEFRSAEQEHVQQISLLEGEVTKLNKAIERSREAYEAMKRNYTSTCDEADRLRTLVADLRRDNRSSEEAIRGHALQVQQFERDREMLQQAVDKLETELTAARLAQDALDDQKQENLLLKETIDKLRFEIEEMRSVGPRSGCVDHGSGSLSPSKSLAESISKSIGREIATRIAAGVDAESDEEDDDATEVEEDPSDDLDDIIVTTHRRIRKRGKRSVQVSEPQVRLASTVEMSDADCQTAAPKHVSMGSQTTLTAARSDLVKMEDVAPPPYPPARPSEEIQRDLAAQLGVDISLVKQLSEARRAGAQMTVEPHPTELLSAPIDVPARCSARWRSRLAPLPTPKAPAYLVNVFPTSARPYVAQLLDSGLSLVLYTATIYLVGVLSGSRFLPLQHRHYFSPVDLGFSPYDGPRWEGLASGAGADGGFAPEGFARILYEALWNGVRTARRVPT